MIHDFIVDLNQFTILKRLGKGGFGEVQLVKHQKTQKLYAAKISILKYEKNEQQRSFFQELEAYLKVKHPAILSFYGFNINGFNNDHFPTIITKYMSKGSLRNVLKNNKSFSFSKKYIIIYGIAEGMRYLHSQAIMHRDLKPDNILIDDNYYPYICDFGISKISESLSISSIL